MLSLEEKKASTFDRGGEQRPPVVASGVELIGQYEGSGFKQPPSLARRADGQILQLPPLLYEVLAAIDGHLSLDEVASVVGERLKRSLSADDVRFLLDERLRPQGLVAAADGSSPRLARPDPFLAFRYRIGVVSEHVSGALGRVFKPFFLTPIVVGLLGCLVVADWWLFFRHGVAQPMRQALYHPSLFLPLLAAIVVSAAFHEVGHASGCRYGGASPGKMGCGLYLAWPAFYTDVSDSYRLNRKGRLRTDFGGVYFNIVIIVATTGLYLLTRNLEALLLLVLIEHTEIAHQLIPAIRLDGYYIVADMTGVPDLFARMGPILSSLMFWRRTDPKVSALKRWVRAAVTAWVLIIVPLLILELLMVLIHLPRILATSWDSAHRLADTAGRYFGRGRIFDAVSDTLQILVLAIPILGILLMIGQLLRRASTWAWARTRGHPMRRILAAAAGAALAVVLALAWLPGRNYQPIKPGEKGTQGQGLHALLTLVGGPGPLYSERAAARTSPTIAPAPPSSPGAPGSGPGAPVRSSGGTGPASPSSPPPAPSTPGSPLPHLPTPPAPQVSVPPMTVPRLPVPPVTVPRLTVPRLPLPPVTLPPTTLPHVTLPPTTLPRATLPPPTLPPPTLP